jgi:hypothetical protein
LSSSTDWRAEPLSLNSAPDMVGWRVAADEAVGSAPDMVSSWPSDELPGSHDPLKKAWKGDSVACC